MKGLIYGALSFVSLSLLLLLGMGLTAPSAYACSRGPTSLEEDFLEAHSIFTATVTKVDAVYPSQKAVSVEPKEVYKGHPPAFVVTNGDSDQCGAGIEEGKTYLFYSHGLELPYVSVFDTHLLGTERAEQLTGWLANRTLKQEPKPPRKEKALAYSQGGIRILFEHHNMGRPEKAFITSDSVYVPLAYFQDPLWFSTDWNQETNEIAIGRTNRMEFETADGDDLHSNVTGTPREIEAEYKGIKIKVENEARVKETLQDDPEALIAGGEIFVPIRPVAEKLGFEVEWVSGTSSVVLHLPFEKKSGTRLLSMRYAINVGMDGILEVDRLTGDEITYRRYQGHMPEGGEVKQERAPFAEMLKEELGFRKYLIQFYLKTDKQDIKLLLSPELVRKIESDATFRNSVGDRLGKQLSTIPANRVLTVKDFE